MFLTGCSSFPIVELIPPAFNFALGFYDHNDYYSKECLWYNEIKLNDATKVSRNNDIYREVCKKDKSMVDKIKDKADRVLDKTLMATEEEEDG